MSSSHLLCSVHEMANLEGKSLLPDVSERALFSVTWPCLSPGSSPWSAQGLVLVVWGACACVCKRASLHPGLGFFFRFRFDVWAARPQHQLPCFLESHPTAPCFPAGFSWWCCISPAQLWHTAALPSAAMLQPTFHPSLLVASLCSSGAGTGMHVDCCCLEVHREVHLYGSCTVLAFCGSTVPLWH